MFTFPRKQSRLLKTLLLSTIIGVSVYLTAVTTIKYTISKPVSAVLIGEMTSESTDSLIKFLLSLPEGTTVNVVVNSPGGDVNALTNILIAKEFKHLKFNTVLVATSMAASAAAILMVESETVVVDPAATIMMHSYTICEPRGILNLPKCSVLTELESDPIKKALFEQVRSLMDKALAKGYLTQFEYNQIISGHDVWISGAELNRRLHK